MPDTDTQSRVTTFIPPIVVQSRYEPYSRSIRNFSYATSTHHDRYAAFEAALAKAGIAKWTLYEILEASDEATIKRIFLEYFDGEPSKLFPDKTEQELNSTVPKEVIDAYLPHIDELHNAQQHDERLFAKQLTDNFIAQLRRQHIPLPGDLESRLETRVEGVLPDIIRRSATLGEVEGKVKNYLVGTLAFIPETQPIAQSQQTTLEQASQEAVGASRQTIIDLMARPQVLTQTIAVPVLDKANFETVLTKLVKETPTFSVARHAVHAETLVRTLEATNATVVGADAARAAGQLLIALAQQSNKPLGVAVATLLSPQTRDRIFEAIAARSWEAAVDNIIRNAATLALDQNILQDIVRRGNETFGISTGKGGAVAARGFAEALWGNIAGPMENYIISQHDLSRLGMPLPQRQFTSAELFIVFAHAYMQGPPVVTMRGEGQKEGGGFLKFVLSWGAEEGAARLINKGVTTAAGGTVKEVVKKGVTSFVTKILTRLGLSALAGVIAPGVGTVVAIAVQAVVWLGGFIVRPLMNWVNGLLRGEKLPFGIGAATTGIGEYFRNVAGGYSATGPKKPFWQQEWFVILALILVAVLLPAYGVKMQTTAQNAALLTSYNAAVGGPENLPERGPFPPTDYFDYTALASKEFQCVAYGDGITTSAGTSQPLAGAQRQKVESAIQEYPQLKLLSCSLGCPANQINITAFAQDGTYAGYAPSGHAGNIIFYPRAFNFTTQGFAGLLAHELAHNIDWLNESVFDEFRNRAYCGRLGTYPWNETIDETFAEAVRLYIIGDPLIRSYCGGRAFDFFNEQFLQCK